MWADILLKSYAVILPIALGYIISLLRKQNKKREANSKGTMLLLRVQLIEYHTKYMRKGSIPLYAYQNFVDMYQAYHELGGNSMVTKMYEEIQELHLQTKERLDNYEKL